MPVSKVRKKPTRNKTKKLPRQVNTTGDLAQVIELLWDLLKREPTTEEVYSFVFGTEEDRQRIIDSAPSQE